MTPEIGAESRWRAAIRDWLLGRLGVGLRTEDLQDPVEATLSTPYLGWWVLEGMRLPITGRPLATSWAEVTREADRLLRTWNPRLRLVDRPEGRVDWERTLALGPRVHAREYVTTTSGVGLRDEERAALLGWCAWILSLWAGWCRRVRLPDPDVCAPLAHWHARHGDGRAWDDAHLHRWAFVARRSRWPLLREVVAPTLWAAVHPEQEVDRVPLPGTREVLFQLYCAVKLASALRPRPRALRWLHRVDEADTASPAGRLEAGALVLEYEVGLDRATVLSEPLFPAEASAGLARHGVGVPQRVDILITLGDPASPWQALLAEVKSGQLVPKDAVFQMLAYRQALRSRFPGRVLVWGLGESEAWRASTPLDEELRAALRGPGDLWLFSTPEEVPDLLDVVMRAS